MVTEIRWSDNAMQDYHLIIEYLLEEWNEDVALQFIELTEYKVQQLAYHPYIGVLSARDNNVRSILITKHNRLYYRFLSEQIVEIANIFDTRQSPSKNKFD
jgi:plasmid stabilization system protein ParE